MGILYFQYCQNFQGPHAYTQTAQDETKRKKPTWSMSPLERENPKIWLNFDFFWAHKPIHRHRPVRKLHTTVSLRCAFHPSMPNLARSVHYIFKFNILNCRHLATQANVERACTTTDLPFSNAIRTYTVSQKYVHFLFFLISLIKINRFQWFLVCEILRKFDIKSLYICPPHLSAVATLPWEIQKVVFNNITSISNIVENDFLDLPR